MKINKFHIYWADLNPQIGTEPEKQRPVIVVQTDLLNQHHFSTIVCPMTSKVVKEASVLRVYVPKKESGLDFDSDILVDQLRAIDNRRFMKHIGKISMSRQNQLIENLKILLLE